MFEVNCTDFVKIHPKTYPDQHCMLIKYNGQEVGILITGASGFMHEKIKGLASLIDSGKPSNTLFFNKPEKKAEVVEPEQTPSSESPVTTEGELPQEGQDELQEDGKVTDEREETGAVSGN